MKSETLISAEIQLDHFEAACLLARNNEIKSAKAILSHLWNQTERSREKEFSYFIAWAELQSLASLETLQFTLEQVTVGAEPFERFWEERTLAEQALALDVLGQVAMKRSDYAMAYSSFARSASFGRDTSLIWFHLAFLSASQGDLDLALRYSRRSLQVFRQPMLNLMSGQVSTFGSFLGRNPLGISLSEDDFLRLLLELTKVAKGRRNLRALREIVVELIHFFPEVEKFRKVRILVENAIVNDGLRVSSGSLSRSV